MKNPSALLQLNPSCRKASSGFSLIELLIVILIISILMTAGVMGLKNLSAGKGTSSAISTCESLFNEARTIAISKNCNSRLMVDIDDINSDNYLRRVVIAHQYIDPNTGIVVPDTWILSSRAYFMPNGTYYSQEYSKLNDESDIPEKVMDLFSLDSSGSKDKNLSQYSGRYVYYEFNAEGIPSLILDEKSFIGASFIIGGGIRRKGQEKPQFIRDAEKDMAGFVIWRNGRTSTYRNPEHMKIYSSRKNF
jgi:prepilin-type N-terminal cleavage/methylation domain-containing protein